MFFLDPEESNESDRIRICILGKFIYWHCCMMYLNVKDIPYFVFKVYSMYTVKYVSFASKASISRGSEPACFKAAPAPGIFYPEPAPGKREHNFGFF